jgi:hypothetical protein
MQINILIYQICFILYFAFCLNCNNIDKNRVQSNRDSSSKARDTIPKRTPIDFKRARLTQTPVGNYESIKYNIIKFRSAFAIYYSNTPDLSKKNSIIDSASNYILEEVVNKLIPHWYKMKWDISGYSEIPQNGFVGCSYFVSNVLKHAGFTLNRYKVAQSYPWGIAKTFQLNDSISYLQNLGIDELTEYIKKKFTDGLYILGLNYHGGFLLIRSKQNYFIHSSFIEPKEVVIEHLTESEAVKMSTVHVIGQITTNRDLIEKWIKNEEIMAINE